MNKCILVGNLTKDPELFSTNSGISVCKFTIACNRTYTNADGTREADYLNVIAWCGLADNCAKYLSKGNKVGVTGSIQTRSYEADDGSKRYITEIAAEEVEFIKTAKDESSSMASEQSKKRNRTADEIKAQGAADIDDDFPF